MNEISGGNIPRSCSRSQNKKVCRYEKEVEALKPAALGLMELSRNNKTSLLISILQQNNHTVEVYTYPGTKEGAEAAAAAASSSSNHRVIIELEHAHAILRKLEAEGPDGFLRKEASAARELARAAAVAPPCRVNVSACTRVRYGLSTARARPVGPIGRVNTYVELFHWCRELANPINTKEDRVGQFCSFR